MTEQATTIDELAFTRPYGEQEKQILTAEAVEFLTELVTHFTPQRNKLLAARIQQQQDIDNGRLPDFISETASIRNSEWQIRGIPQDLLDRRVEITGPVERKMVINAPNANVKVFMADFEDSLAPNWGKVIDGQINLRDAVNGTYGSGDADISALADLGIKVDAATGNMTLDESKLDKAIADNPDAIKNMFVGSNGDTGMASSLNDIVTRYIGDPDDSSKKKDDSIIEMATDDLNAQVKLMDAQIDKTQKLIDAQVERYRVQFQNLDATQSKLTNLGNQLTSMLASL